MNSVRLATAALAALTGAGMTHAQDGMSFSESVPQRVSLAHPKRVAIDAWPPAAVALRAIRVEPTGDGTWNPLGEWFAPIGGTRGAVGECSDGVAFNSAALHPNLFFPDPPDPNCASYGWFGPTHRNVRHANDFQVETAYAGGVGRELGFVWHNAVDGERQLIAFSTYENGAPDSCGLDTNGDGQPDVVMSGHLSTFVIDFGPRPFGSQYAHASLCADSVGLRLPVDGRGMYEMIIARAFDDTNGDGTPDTLIFATSAQPLLFYNFNDADGDGVNEWQLAGTQTPVQFDDLAPHNGIYDLGDANSDGRPDECFRYDFAIIGACSRYASSAVMIWADADGTTPCFGDISGNGAVDLADLSIMLSGFGTCSGQSGYSPAADLVLNGCVDLSDLAALLAEFGTVCR